MVRELSGVVEVFYILVRDVGCMSVCICEDSFKCTLTICDFHCKFYLKNAENGNVLPSIA